MKHTHSDRLERWLGKAQVEELSARFKNFYWPVAVHGIPGNVHIMPGGDFVGEIKAGQFLSKEDGAAIVLKKLRQQAELKERRFKALGTLVEMIKVGDMHLASVGAFASIDAVIAAYTGGKGQQTVFQKTGVTPNAIGNSNDLWTRTGYPLAGAAGSAAPAGVAPTSATVGALPFLNKGAANSGHYLNWALSASVVNNSLLLYDRLFAVVKTMNSAAAEAVTGLPTRYQNTVTSAVDYIGGNFCFPANPTTVLAATAHNWTPCTYLDDAGAAGTFNSLAGVSACVVGGVDLAVGNWFMPLAAGDVGVKGLTSLQCSALVATGTIDFVIAHPIAINACPIANLACLDDGLYTSLNLTPILDNACLSFLELTKSATTATNYSGLLRAVSE